VETAAITSYRSLTLDPYPFNFADLNSPVPWSAWIGMPDFDCVSARSDIATVIHERYVPQILIPPEVRSVDPAWADCDIQQRGVQDPPHALQTADSLKLEDGATAKPVAVPDAGQTKSTKAANSPAVPKTKDAEPVQTKTASNNQASDPPKEEQASNGQFGSGNTPALMGGVASAILKGLGIAPGKPSPVTIQVDPTDPDKVIIGPMTFKSGEVATIRDKVISVAPGENIVFSQSGVSGAPRTLSGPAAHTVFTPEATANSASKLRGFSAILVLYSCILLCS
jgi:hypothetical protein